jgi:hypothetical protein
MAKIRIPLENVEGELAEEVTIRFPVELRALKNTTKLYDGIPSFNLSVYRNIKEREYKEREGAA